jgi:hypothetical protein
MKEEKRGERREKKGGERERDPLIPDQHLVPTYRSNVTFDAYLSEAEGRSCVEVPRPGSPAGKSGDCAKPRAKLEGFRYYVVVINIPLSKIVWPA